MNKKIMAMSVLIAVLFVSSIAGTIFYYRNVVNDKNSKIASLNSQIANQNNEIAKLTSQISNLTAEVTNLTSANLVTALGISEVPYDAPNNMGVILFSRLYISGSVTNTGEGTALNAGLHVVAYQTGGGPSFQFDLVEINMTVPLANGASFGTDNATDAFVSNWTGLSSLQLGDLGSGQTATISINIYHEGVVSNWTVTPVWTNSL